MRSISDLILHRSVLLMGLSAAGGESSCWADPDGRETDVAGGAGRLSTTR